MGRKKLAINRSALILQAAADLFAEFGYEKTTLDEIALNAGIGKGSIYLEFDGKEAILFALILQNKRAQMAQMQRIAERWDKPALELLKAMLIQNIGVVFETVKRNRRSPEEMAANRERVRSLLKPFLDGRLALVSRLLQRAIEEGTVDSDTDTEKVAQLIMLAMRGVLPPYVASDTRLKLQNRAAELLELLFNGLAASSGSRSLLNFSTETGTHHHE